ncbi:MAG TPA: methyltransferase domain-containing protein [Acidimicrobiales bacterium]|nr:methyltransferase domain-containing protein [Acidimicrobiales bacterium]
MQREHGSLAVRDRREHEQSCGAEQRRGTARTARVMSERSLQRLYEDPATPLSSGLERAQLQAAMLADIASAARRRLVAVDVGCGDGMATALAAACCAATPGADVSLIGLDWSSAAVDRARRRGVPVARAAVDGSGLPLASGSVDVVVMSELIEHLVDTDAALAEARRVLVPGGALLLSTPNLAAWYNRVLLGFGVQPLFTEVSLHGIYGRPGRQVVGHLRIFTRRSLRELLAAAGFADITITGAPYHDVPRPFRPVDRLFCRTPSLSSILLASARRSA